jgi:hypothetical protein
VPQITAESIIALQERVELLTAVGFSPPRRHAPPGSHAPREASRAERSAEQSIDEIEPGVLLRAVEPSMRRQRGLARRRTAPPAGPLACASTACRSVVQHTQPRPGS